MPSRPLRRRRLARLAAVAGCLAAASTAAVGGAPASSADAVTTKDGLVLEGRAVRAPDGSVTVTTATGIVRLAADRVSAVETGEGPRAAIERESAALAPSDAVGHFRLALRAEAKGLADLARREHEAVVAVDPDNAASRRALGQERVDGAWVASDDAMRRRGFVLYGGRWLLAQEADAAARAESSAAPAAAADGGIVSLASAMRTAATGEPALAAAARVRTLSSPAPSRVRAATALLSDADPRVRSWSAAELGALGDEAALRPLLRSAVRDRDPDVRRAAVLAVASFGHDDAAIPFARALGSEHPGIVANAARALGMLGDRRAIGYVVKHLYGHGTSPRVVMQELKKVSYVRDYDVEIAQAANIANPIIGTAVEGSVFDVKVLDASIEKTVVETVLVDAFNALAGTSFHEPSEVLAWWSKNGDSVPAYPDEPDARRHRKAPTAPAK